MTTRDLTPALERVATLAGAVADSFEKGAELLEEMAGVRLSEATVERTTEDAGRRLADAVAAGATFGPQADWPWHKDYDGKRCAYVELDATGVRQQAAGGGPAEGRMAYVGMVCNPCPEWPWPDEKPGPMRARYLSGLYPLEDFAPLLRTPGGARGHGPGRPLDRAVRRRQRPGGPAAGELPARGAWSSWTSSTRRRSSPGWRGCCTPRTRTGRRSRRGSGAGCSRTKGARCWPPC